jgi:hypothetical protein
MKIARLFLAAAAVLSLGISAYAQSSSSWTVNIPFDFSVRHTYVEAGRYTVRQSGSVVFLTSESGRTVNVMTNRDDLAEPSDYSSLVFNRVGDNYALAQIKNVGSNIELNAVVSKHAPKRLEASNSAQVVEVAAIGTR